MTSQVAIMNLYGVAIASDSLASRRAEDGFITTDGNKKIWSIGPEHKVVALHYGSTVIGSMPHQIHFEAWARTLTKPLPNVPAYVKSYQAYCASSKSIHGRKTEDDISFTIFHDALTRLRNNLTADPEAEPEKFHQTATEFKAFYTKAKKFAGTSDEWLEETIKKQKIDLNKLINNYFEFKFAAKTRTAIKQGMKQFYLAALGIKSDTNLMFVGFGAKDDFAGAQRLFMRGITNGKLLSFTDEPVYVSPDGIDSRILYAAQFDAMKMFVQGIHPQMFDTLSTIAHNVLQEHLPEDTQPDKVHEISSKIVEGLQQHSDEQYVQPAFNAILNMNTDQLAASARGLVLLQTAAASIGTSSPTVGGQVEVVTLQKA